MVDYIWVDSRHGLSLNEGPHPYRDNENGVLFYLEYILMKEAKGEDISADVAEFKAIIERIRTQRPDGSKIMGLYDRGEGESLREDKETIRTISHDNLTAISAFDYRYGNGDEGKVITLHGLKYQLRYDNAYPDNQRWNRVQWPTDLGFWAYSSKKWYLAPVAIVMFPFFVLRSALSSFTEYSNTSGKLLNFVRFAASRDKHIVGKLLWKLYSMKMKAQYGENWIHEIMKIYFLNPNHPNRVLSDNLKM